MLPFAARTEPTAVRRAFAAWSIEVPVAFAETYVDEESYWHAWDGSRSVSLSSVVLTDKHRPVPAAAIAREFSPLGGTPFEEMPEGLIGRAMTGAAIQPAKASRVLAGMLATDGRVLIVTITSDDLDWARRVWLSIRGHPAPLPSRRERRAASRRQRRRR
jgi:hypothetical protein